MKEYFLKNKDDFLNAEYVVFGAGRTGKRFYSKFKEKIKIKFFIDNNLELYNLRIDEMNHIGLSGQVKWRVSPHFVH